MISASPFGFAYHRVIVDGHGNPVDYEFLEVNRAFERITGLNEKEIIGKTVCDVLPGIREGHFDWVQTYGDIAINGGESEFEQYSKPLGRWYKGYAFSDQKYYFSVIFVDITAQKSLSLIAAAFNNFSARTLDLQYVVEKAKEISGAAYVVLNKFDENGRDFSSIAFCGVNKHLENAVSMLGFNIRGKKWGYDPLRQQKIDNQKTTVFQHLTDLTGTVIPEKIAILLCDTFDIGQVAVVKTTRDNTMLGDFTLIFPRRGRLENRETLETYADLTGMLLSRIDDEKKALKEQARFKNITDTMTDIVWRTDLQLSPLFTSPSVERILGFPLEEYNKLTAEQRYTPETLQRIQLILREELKKEHAPAGDIGRTRTIEIRQYKNDGSVVPMEISISLLRDETGMPVGFQGISRDITDRKKAEEELMESEIRLTAAIEGTEAGIWDWDMVQNQVYFSPQWKAMLGYEEAEIENSFEGWKNLWHPDDAVAIEKAVTDHMKGLSEKYEIIHRCRHKDGEWRWLMTRGKILRGTAGNPYRWIGTNIDITDRKKAEEVMKTAKEQAEAASKSKSAFLANMSHEIRTPLNSVIGFTDLLKSTPLSPAQRQYVDNANISGHTLLGIIDAILDFSKIEAGMLELEAVKTDMVELLENSVEIVKFAADRKGLEILLDIDPCMPRFALVDPVRLKQVFTNLLGNAVKFTEKGEVELKAGYEGLGDGQAKLSFEVRDTGIGISEAQKEKLFKAFSQADSSTSRKFGGTGLGLIISDKIAAKMGSKISFSSAPGVGTSFFFSITTTGEDSETPDISRIANVKRCLIIDDNAKNCQILERMVAQWKIECDEYRNGREALKRLVTSNPFDVILCDYMMPDNDGLETIRIIRETLKMNAEKLPVILLHSSLEDAELRRKCEEMGVRFILNKPVRSRDLFSCLCALRQPKEDIPEQDCVSDNGRTTQGIIAGKAKILVAEDVSMNMLLITSLMSYLMPDAEVYEATNGLQAVEQYVILSPDAVLMDVQMPEFDGLAATARIRSLEAATGKHTPIIALTAGASKEEQDNCLNAGMDDVLTKPIDHEKLKKVCKKYFAKSDEGVPGEEIPSAGIAIDGAAHFEYEKLSDILRNDRQLIEEIIAISLQTIPVELERLAAAINERDNGKIKAVAHSMKGGAFTMRLHEFAAILVKIEEATREPNRLDMQEMLSELKIEWESVKNLLLKHC